MPIYKTTSLHSAVGTNITAVWIESKAGIKKPKWEKSSGNKWSLPPRNPVWLCSPQTPTSPGSLTSANQKRGGPDEQNP